jgi:hypothetical protein
MRLPLSESFPRVVGRGKREGQATMGFLDPSVILYAVFGIGIFGVFGAVLAVRFL